MTEILYAERLAPGLARIEILYADQRERGMVSCSLLRKAKPCAECDVVIAAKQPAWRDITSCKMWRAKRWCERCMDIIIARSAQRKAVMP